jgi:hypothetical protein
MHPCRQKGRDCATCEAGWHAPSLRRTRRSRSCALRVGRIRAGRRHPILPHSAPLRSTTCTSGNAPAHALPCGATWLAWAPEGPSAATRQPGSPPGHGALRFKPLSKWEDGAKEGLEPFKISLVFGLRCDHASALAPKIAPSRSPLGCGILSTMSSPRRTLQLSQLPGQCSQHRPRAALVGVAGYLRLALSGPGSG